MDDFMSQATELMPQIVQFGKWYLVVGLLFVGIIFIVISVFFIRMWRKASKDFDDEERRFRRR